LITAEKSAVFSNWIMFRRQIYNYGLLQDRNLIIDMSNCTLVDHTVMEKLGELKRDFADKGLRLEVKGLENHLAMSEHPTAARRGGDSSRKLVSNGSNGSHDTAALEKTPAHH
jgi:hypothetical protein